MTIVHVVVDARGRDPRAVVAPTIAVHVAQENYGRMLRGAGVLVDPANPVATAGHLIDTGTVMTGGPDDIARQIHELHGMGVDEVVLNPGGVLHADGVHAAVEDAQAIVSAWEKRGTGV